MRQEQSATIRYISETFAAEDEELTQIRAVGERLVPGMQVGAMEGRLLHCLLTMIGARRVLEIGSFVGYSTVCMARALPGNGQIITCEFKREYADYARKHSAKYPVNVLEGDALTLIETVDGPFDAVFIDAEKRRYMDYLDAVLPKLRSGGLVMADNSLLFGAMAGEPERDTISAEAKAVMSAFNKRLAGEEFRSGILIPTPEGLTVGVNDKCF